MQRDASAASATELLTVHDVHACRVQKADLYIRKIVLTCDFPLKYTRVLFVLWLK